MTSCNKCAGDNQVTEVTQSEGGYILEAKTKCNDCGFKDYWAYGFFDSGQDMVSRCKRYRR